MEFILQALFKLIIAHALVDFALQSDAMAKGKNRHNQPDYIPAGQKYVPCWPYWLAAHALIHGGAVWAVTQSPVLGFIEVLLHLGIDGVKCEGITNPHQDQFLHMATKILYVGMLPIMRTF